MANQWLRLWHDMPTDPKWRTISRISKQSISDVIAVYIHILVCASNAEERGVTQGWEDEDVATSLDLQTDQVSSIISAMQGRVLDKSQVMGWNKRQPKREDNSTERTKKWREQKTIETQCDATERNVTLDKDKDKDKDNKKAKISLDELSSFHISEWLLSEREKGRYKNHDPEFVLQQFKQYCEANGKRYKDYVSAYRNAFEWEKCQGKAEPRKLWS